MQAWVPGAELASRSSVTRSLEIEALAAEAGGWGARTFHWFTEGLPWEVV